MDYAAIVVLEILYMIAFLALISAGLAIVFGMMRVINLAHGEFVMLGGYATIAAAKAGINVYFAMLVIAPLVVGIVGLEFAPDRARDVDLRQHAGQRADAYSWLSDWPLSDGRL
jgi:branched-subunit amino acid ABC-type transport system permease component